MQQHDDRDADADQLAARGLLRELGERTGELDLHTAGPGARRDRRGVVELRGRELVDRVGDVEVGRLPVGADARRPAARTDR